MKKKYYLIDYHHGKQQEKQNQIYEIASKIALKYGRLGNEFSQFNLDHILEFWNGQGDYPSPTTFKRMIRMSHLKWFIHNKVNCQDPIWNGDFLHGLMVHVKIYWNKKGFPSCEWFCNTDLVDILKTCPFGGKIVDLPSFYKSRWVGVPALYLKSSEDSISFMAGIMSGMRTVKRGEFEYALTSSKSIDYIKKWGIPIEGEYNKSFLLSPVWPALFIHHMPEICRSKWLKIKKPYNGFLYALVLWRTYVDCYFPSRGIPYLKCRRAVYNRLQCPEGVMKKIEMLRVEKGLTELDNRIREVVREWKNKQEKKDV